MRLGLRLLGEDLGEAIGDVWGKVLGRIYGMFWDNRLTDYALDGGEFSGLLCDSHCGGIAGLMLARTGGGDSDNIFWWS